MRFGFVLPEQTEEFTMPAQQRVFRQQFGFASGQIGKCCAGYLGYPF